MGRKKTIQVLNWEKYQARTDKELPWCKLWGALFKRPWFQALKDDEKYCTLLFLDLARQFNNKIPDLSEFKGYLRGNYGLFMEEERVFKLCKVLADNGFLSDNVSDIQDKTRVDEMRRDEKESPATPDSSKQVCLKDIEIKDQSEGVKHKIFNQMVDTFKVRGWRTEPEYVKNVLKAIVARLEEYDPRSFFPYFKKAANNYINEHADALSADAQIARKQAKPLGVMVGVNS